MLYAKYSFLYKLAKCALNFAFKLTVFRFILFTYVLTAFQASEVLFRPANCCQEIRLH